MELGCTGDGRFWNVDPVPFEHWSQEQAQGLMREGELTDINEESDRDKKNDPEEVTPA